MKIAYILLIVFGTLDVAVIIHYLRSSLVFTKNGIASKKGEFLGSVLMIWLLTSLIASTYLLEKGSLNPFEINCLVGSILAVVASGAILLIGVINSFAGR